MATGKQHAKASLILAIPAGVGVGLINPLAGAAACVGCLLGIPIGPDLDQEGISAAEWKIIKWTLGLGFLWLMFWWPYALIHSHRGVSHIPIVGTLGRLLYMAILLIIIWLILGCKPLPVIDPWLLKGLVAGLILSDILHWVMDLGGKS